MTIDIKSLCDRLEPSKTVLFFGAGSSIPSGGSTGQELSDLIARDLKFDDLVGMPLQETSALIVKTLGGRKELIRSLRKFISPLRPTRGLLNLPLFDWREIFTTNYDNLIEQAYQKAGREYKQISTNYELDGESSKDNVHIYKLHGTIEKDVSDGDASRIIITDGDYDIVKEFRDSIFDRLRDQINRSDLLIIGHSLADPDLKESINYSLRLKAKGAGGRIYLILFSDEPSRAALLEDRGIVVSFGGIDKFAGELSNGLPDRQTVASVGEPLDASAKLRPTVTDVAHATQAQRADVLSLFHGSPATYADIAAGLVFDRDFTPQLETQLCGDSKFIAVVLGVAGVGKTTLCRQALYNIVKRGFHAWEHDDNSPLNADEWIRVGEHLETHRKDGVLFIDDCQDHLRSINALVDGLVRKNIKSLRLLLATSPAAWNPRVKSPSIFACSNFYRLRQLNASEIDSLLSLVDRQPAIRELVERQFSGFSQAARRQRLLERCGSDMFVCLKNIFAHDDLDVIILREYAELTDANREIYRLVSAMEAAGVRVHRQFLIRSLNIDAESIGGILSNLDGTISERSVSEREGIYEWNGRHLVVSQTISKYEFSDQDEIFSLLDNIAENVNPTYEIEVRTIKGALQQLFWDSQIAQQGEAKLPLSATNFCSSSGTGAAASLD